MTSKKHQVSQCDDILDDSRTFSKTEVTLRMRNWNRGSILTSALRKINFTKLSGLLSLGDVIWRYIALSSNIHSIFTILCNTLPYGECWISDSEIVEETEKSDVDNNAAHQELLDCAIDGASGRDRVLRKRNIVPRDAHTARYHGHSADKPRHHDRPGIESDGHNILVAVTPS